MKTAAGLDDVDPDGTGDFENGNMPESITVAVHGVERRGITRVKSELGVPNRGEPYEALDESIFSA